MAFFDLECSGLKPQFAVMLCGGVLPAGGKPYVIQDGRKGEDDKVLVEAIIKALEQYDVLIGFNSINFDIRFLNSRALKHGLKPLSPKLHIDLYRICKTIFKTTMYTSCSLKSLCTFMHISGAGGEKKGNVDPDAWMKAAYGGDKYALNKIVQHCREDIMVLPPLYEKVKYQIRSISRS